MFTEKHFEMAAAMYQVNRLERYLENMAREVTKVQYYVDDMQKIHENLMEFIDHSRTNNMQFEGIEGMEIETWKNRSRQLSMKN